MARHLATERRTRGSHADHSSQAQCASADRRCTAMFCPRHRPDDYASHMARHATDSVQVSL